MNNKYKLNLNLTDKLDYYNVDITSNFYKKYIKLVYKYFDLFGEECKNQLTRSKKIMITCKEPYVFSSLFTDFYYITGKNTTYKIDPDLVNKKNKNLSIEKINKKYRRLTKIVNYIPISSYFHWAYELLFCNNIIKNNVNNLILIKKRNGAYLYSMLEAIIFYNNIKKFKIKNNILIYDILNNIVNIKKKLKKIKFMKHINKIMINKYFDVKSLNKNNYKYDNIFCCTSNAPRMGHIVFIIDNNNYYFYNLLYSILHLKKGGNVILGYDITSKFYADCIIYFKYYFEEIVIKESEIFQSSASGQYLIFKNFKDNLTKKNIKKLINILKLLIKNNNNFENFNIKNKKFRKKYNSQREITIYSTFKYPYSLLANTNNKDYKEIYDFNLYRYEKVYNYKLKILDYYNKYIDILLQKTNNDYYKMYKYIPYDIRNQQLINCYYYANKYKLEYTELNINDINKIFINIKNYFKNFKKIIKISLDDEIKNNKNIINIKNKNYDKLNNNNSIFNINYNLNNKKNKNLYNTLFFNNKDINDNYNLLFLLNKLSIKNYYFINDDFKNINISNDCLYIINNNIKINNIKNIKKILIKMYYNIDYFNIIKYLIKHYNIVFYKINNINNNNYYYIYCLKKNKINNLKYINNKINFIINEFLLNDLNNIKNNIYYLKNITYLDKNYIEKIKKFNNLYNNKIYQNIINNNNNKIINNKYLNSYKKDKKFVNNFYVEMNTNYQIFTLIYNIENQNLNNQNKSILKNRLYRLFYVYIDENEFNKLYYKILNKKLKDVDILLKIFGKPKKIKETFKNKYIEMDANMIYNNIKNNTKINIKNILDFGGGNCKIINKLGILLNLNKKNVHCCDIKNITKLNNITFKLINSNEKLPYKNKQFDCIIIRKVISYINNFDFVIKELYRILKKNGILYIEEYSAINDYDYLICDIQRLFQKYKNNKLSEIENYKVNYLDKFELKNILTSNKFNFIFESDKFWNSSKILSPTNLNWSIYLK